MKFKKPNWLKKLTKSQSYKIANLLSDPFAKVATTKFFYLLLIVYRKFMLFVIVSVGFARFFPNLVSHSQRN
jgi:hypothetical protein